MQWRITPSSSQSIRQIPPIDKVQSNGPQRFDPNFHLFRLLTPCHTRIDSGPSRTRRGHDRLLLTFRQEPRLPRALRTFFTKHKPRHIDT